MAGRSSSRASSATTKDDISAAAPSLELQKKNLNVAAGFQFYERAQSRRERHRAALREAAQDTVALGGGGGGASSKRSQPKQKQEQNNKKMRTLFQEDADEREARYEDMGRRRVVGGGRIEQLCSSPDSLPKQIVSAQAVKAQVAKLKQAQQQQRAAVAAGKSIVLANNKTAATSTTLSKPKAIARRTSSSSTAKSRLMGKLDQRGKK